MGESKIAGRVRLFVAMCRELRELGANGVQWGKFSAAFEAPAAERGDGEHVEHEVTSTVGFMIDGVCGEDECDDESRGGE